MNIYNMTDNNYDKYMKLLVRRDQLKQEAAGWHAKYVAEFGEKLCKLFEEQMKCVELKKKIHFCQLQRNHGMKVDKEEMEKNVAMQMKSSMEQLRKMREGYEMASNLKSIPHVTVMRVKSLYRKIVKMIHPDLRPHLAGDEEVETFWIRAQEAYENYDVDELESLEALIKNHLLMIGEEIDEKIEIHELEAKILHIENDIDTILETDPYLYSVLLTQPDLVGQRHEELSENILNYQKHAVELEHILETFLTDGEVTIECDPM
ncbi:MAG: hypothetical protein K6A81_01495 [Clostridiales bacterium]|nr:hypothetical protein [Clostridiales bacterium]